ncbi:MAG: HAD family hydrolase [Chloroflexota bacterium]
MPPLLLFDLDGTLLEPRDPLHTRAFNDVLVEFCGSQATMDWQGTSGMVDRAILARLFQRAGMHPVDARALLTRACRVMAASYARGPMDHSSDRVLPGAREILAHLHAQKTPMGLLTGNVGAIAWGRVDQADLRQYFASGAFGDEAMRRSTLVKRAIRRCEAALDTRFSLAEVIVIGDTPRDIQAAHRAGVRCIAVATGQYSWDDLERHEPSVTLPDLTDTVRVTNALRSLV